MPSARGAAKEMTRCRVEELDWVVGGNRGWLNEMTLCIGFC